MHEGGRPHSVIVGDFRIRFVPRFDVRGYPALGGGRTSDSQSLNCFRVAEQPHRSHPKADLDRLPDPKFGSKYRVRSGRKGSCKSMAREEIP